AQLRIGARFLAEHAHFIERCRAAGQLRPTPLPLRHREGDYNCLHQDLYGEHVFPLQAAVLLAKPGADFARGEYVIAEQRPRMKARADAAPREQADALVFAVHHRPV
ncbi:2OG-Fe(II) oxygenase, partial [Burkholderia pseudomallei]|uniref:2OG-Fe(II) oxygenase n=1 Tax=Burkholderia pseudomallei TaxID=28450 RepID=UPI00158990B0